MADIENKFETLKDDETPADPAVEEETNGMLDACKKEEEEDVEPGEGENRLQFKYSYWFSARSTNKSSSSNYDQHLKKIGTFASVEQFWAYYKYLMQPNDLGGHFDYHIFKQGIRPMWEDEANKNGGKWMIRLKKGLSTRCWENLVCAMLGEQFLVGEEICGAVISLRFQEDILSLWNRSASDQVTTAKIRDTLKRVLNLPGNTVMEYKMHSMSMKDNSSYRNTDVFMK